MKERRITFRIDNDLYFHIYEIMKERKFNDLSTTIRHILEHFLMDYYCLNTLKKRIEHEEEIKNKFFSKYLSKKVIKSMINKDINKLDGINDRKNKAKITKRMD